mmetsp:Transcript_16311/g.23231  ORF Transcript_16311/g.23231 Transcript_16311/m.23231 type:complete len:108 (-) Transcript_16311:566-889(-)
MIQNADGVALWNLCADRYALTKKGYYDKEEMMTEFKSLTKDDKESNSNFLKRVEAKVNEMELHDITLKSHVIALTLLQGLISEHLRTPIVAIMQDEGNGDFNDWIKE